MFYGKMCTFHQIFRGHFWFLAVWNFFCNILIPDSVHQAHIFSYQFLSLSGLSGHIKKCPHHYNLLYQWLKKKKKNGSSEIKKLHFANSVLGLNLIQHTFILPRCYQSDWGWPSIPQRAFWSNCHSWWTCHSSMSCSE